MKAVRMVERESPAAATGAPGTGAPGMGAGTASGRRAEAAPHRLARIAWRAPALVEISVAAITRNHPDVGGDGLGFGSTVS